MCNYVSEIMHFPRNKLSLETGENCTKWNSMWDGHSKYVGITRPYSVYNWVPVGISWPVLRRASPVCFPEPVCWSCGRVSAALSRWSQWFWGAARVKHVAFWVHLWELRSTSERGSSLLYAGLEGERSAARIPRLHCFWDVYEERTRVDDKGQTHSLVSM